MQHLETNSSFWKVAVCVIALSSVAVYAPVLIGFVPFPAGLVFDFPLFAKAAPPNVTSNLPDVGDLVSQFYPYRWMAWKAARHGSLPLWNPYMLSGTPFQANPLSALFYPPNWLYFFLPVRAAWALGFLLRTFLSGLFTALLMRKLGATSTGACVAGLLFTFCGFMTVWQGQTPVDAFIWLPLMCYVIACLNAEPSPAWVAAAAVAFAMPALAGHPETCVHLTLTGTFFALFLAFSGRPSPWRFLGYFIAAGVLGVTLAAVQLIPSIEWSMHVYGLQFIWDAPPLWNILGLVSRDLSVQDTIIPLNSFGLAVPNQASYIGMMGFIAAPVAFLGERKRFAVFFAVLALLAFSAAFGIGPALNILHHIPFIQHMKHDRLVMISIFGVAVLAGLGITAIEQLNAGDRSRRAGATVLAAAGFYVAAMMIYAVHRVTFIIPGPLQQPKASFVLLLASAAVLLWYLSGRARPVWFRMTVIAVVGLDVCTFAYGFIPFERPRSVYPPNELLDWLAAYQKGPFRMLELGLALPSNAQSVYELDDAGGYEIPLERIIKFAQGLTTGHSDAAVFTVKSVLDTTDRRIDMLNTTYFVVSEWDPRAPEFRKHPDRFRFLHTYADTTVYENLKAFPPAYLMPAAGVEVISDDNAQLLRLKDPGFDAEHHVIVPESPAQPDPFPRTTATSTKIEWTRRGVNSSEMNVSTLETSVLVLSQIYYPGWKAYIDGRPVSITRANYAFPAILLPAGSHHVRFSFEPWTFKLGLVLTVLAVIVLATISRRAMKKAAVM